MPDQRRLFGDSGEALAASFLQSKGMKVIDTQQSCRLGEVDLVCEHKGELVFVEVKTRHDNQYGFPEEAVTVHKIRKIVNAARIYLQKRNKEEVFWRIDVVAIQIRENSNPEILHIENIDIPEGLW
ncbi:MAG: YraN family protein [Patescibacteria group bacterium]